MTMPMALVAVPMRRMAMGAPASTLRAAMGEWVAGPWQVACRRSMCHGSRGMLGEDKGARGNGGCTLP